VTRQEWLRDDPYVDVPLFESADELEQLERKHGICETCGELTSDVDEIICRSCEGAEHE
jgi:hypothetical protein